MHQEEAAITLLEFSTNTEHEDNIDCNTFRDVQENAELCSDAIADVKDFQACIPSVNQCTGTMTEITGELVEDLIECYDSGMLCRQCQESLFLTSVLQDDTDLSSRQMRDAIFCLLIHMYQTVLLSFHQFITVLSCV